MGNLSRGVAMAAIAVSLLGASSVSTSAAAELTTQQKQGYYEQYQKSVAGVMEQKLGLHLEVPPMDQFQPEEWVEPQVYDKRIGDIVQQYRSDEQKALRTLSAAPPTVTDANGQTKKIVQVYVGDALHPIEVIGHFQTQLDERSGRQMFAAADNIMMKAADSGIWNQTAYKATLIDGGRTYSVTIEGVYTLAGVSFPKACTVEFQCGEVGQIY
ncbi:hypothetical protein [Ectobacillus ponti]|uniref:Lipoprotein n=1 Tax=Ectobacillus ponti TaxID=2961894 RepID=A0AA41X498_9BACI|nr:hypothetical protein [Ectobacillus ponti]MCP8968447.1 hypothetical protein [Ectobacillus ponti]